jgi:putative heme-binding domain-containing protein
LSVDPFLLHAAVNAKLDSFEQVKTSRVSRESVLRGLDSQWPAERMATAIAARRCGYIQLNELVAELLADKDERIRKFGLLWLGDARPADADRYRWRVESLLKQPGVTKQVFELAIATLDVLEGAARDPKKEPSGEDFMLKLLSSDDSPPEIRRLALRSLSPDNPGLKAELLVKYLGDSDAALRLEAIRTIRQRADAPRWPQLRDIAASADRPAEERCEAILGLSPDDADDRKLLFSLAGDDNPEIAGEALRAIRGLELSANELTQLRSLQAKAAGPLKGLVQRILLKSPPQDLPKHEDVAAWLKLAEGEGNSQAGERIFYSPRVGGCFRCHEFEGRGERVGPDLSTIGRALTRERLVQSIVDPSREIAPQFTSYSILLKSGEVLTGIHVGDEVDGRMKFADANGRVFHVHPNDIDRRQPSRQSIMPENLADNLTPQELRDLIAFLLKAN